MIQETREKLKKVEAYLDRKGMDGVLLQLRHNFAWITAGRDNHIPNNSPLGVAAILVRKGSVLCLANSIEYPRMVEEELAAAGIESVEFPWWNVEAARSVLNDLVASPRIGCDADAMGLGLRPLDAEFDVLRYSLGASEVARFREGAKRTIAALEQTCRQAPRGASEHEIAGILDHNVHAAGCNPLVTLVAGDDRVRKFRHPIPTDNKVNKYAMLVTCAEYQGLITNITRFYSFGALDGDLARRHQASCNVDAWVNLATRPGRILGEVFADLQTAYSANGFADEWQKHHQGGPCGYQTREKIATPDSADRVLESQAFAWNPSITGTKSEDTVLVTSKGVEVLSRSSSDWPVVVGECPLGKLPRAGILVR